MQMFPGSLPGLGWARLYGCPCCRVGRWLRHHRVPGWDQYHRASRQQPQRERSLQQHLPRRSKSEVYIQQTTAKFSQQVLCVGPTAWKPISIIVAM